MATAMAKVKLRAADRRTRRRGLTVLLLDTFLMWGGFFMVVPLISVHFVDGLGWAAGSVGLVLAVRQLTQQGFAAVGGVLADRWGAKGPICAGLLVRGIGFGSMAWADSLAVLFLTVAVSAIGGALFEAPKSAAIAALTEQATRARFYALAGVVAGLGLTIGPLVGSFLLGVGFDAVALTAGGCFALTATVTFLFLPPVRVASGEGTLFAGVGLALRDRSFLGFNILLMGYWFLWVQMVISIPLVATAIAGTGRAVSWVYAVNAGLSILLQYPMLRLGERWLRPMPILIIGVGLMGLGLAGIAVAGSLAGLLGCVAAFSIGSLLASPTQQTVSAELANPVALGSYFAVGSLALAIGGGLGNYAGGLLYEVGHSLSRPELPWLVFGGVGAATTAGLVVFHRRRERSERARSSAPIAAAG
ncbi:MAG: MFS superfamily export protein YceL [uncultured Thermomicrobiales bacterium]|uniref:MFS superfamily export protein YceL n=1 Tax=uncultured Thermomicrobiales bacterium TaxID=1645740 RepID=A0A6J4V306_9BACT|nr:MAG: MFS superfamily export protein YceL [uncultured Thermomicrobiales bacterium]